MKLGKSCCDKNWVVIQMVEGVDMIMNKEFVMGMKGQPIRRDET